MNQNKIKNPLFGFSRFDILTVTTHLVRAYVAPLLAIAPELKNGNLEKILILILCILSSKNILLSHNF